MSKKLSSLNVIDIINKDSEKWIKIKDFEFLYKKLKGQDFINFSSEVESDKINNISSYAKLLSASIKDWRNVRLKDLVEPDYDGDDIDEEVEFSRELFDIFLSQNFNLLPDIFNSIDAVKAKEEKKVAKTKKK